MPTQTQYTSRGQTPYMEQLFVTTMDKWHDKIEDMIHYEHPETALMKECKDTKWFDGGTQFVMPVEIAENPNGGMIDEETGLSMDDFDPNDGLIWTVKHAGYGVRWSKSQQRMNRGSSKRFSIIEQKIDATVKSLRTTMIDQFWNGSGSGKNANGMSILIPAQTRATQNTSGTTIGGKTPVGNLWWQTWGTDMTGLSSTRYLEDKLINMWNNIKGEGGNPNVHITDQTTYETYEANCMDTVVTSPTKFADATFELPQFKRQPIVFSKSAPSGQWRMFDKKAFKYLVDPDYDIAWTGHKEIPNVPFTKVQQVIIDFQFARVQARHMGCIFSISE